MIDQFNRNRSRSQQRRSGVGMPAVQLAMNPDRRGRRCWQCPTRQAPVHTQMPSEAPTAARRRRTCWLTGSRSVIPARIRRIVPGRYDEASRGHGSRSRRWPAPTRCGPALHCRQGKLGSTQANGSPRAAVVMWAAGATISCGPNRPGDNCRSTLARGLGYRQLSARHRKGR